MAELRFACDAMLGRLAHWLRLAGWDASFDAAVRGLGLAGWARSEGRWLLTCDRRLAAAAGPRVVLLHANGVAAQVRELRERLPLAVSPAHFLSRCSACNGELAPAARATVANLVPPYVAAHASRFLRCPGCGRVYWPGSHAAAITRRLEAWFVA